MSRIWFLENVNLFKMLCPHKFAEYKNSHKFKKYGKRDYIYFEEDSSSKVYLIEKGKVKLGNYTKDGNEVIKAILCKGEVFGENAILGEEKRNEFAQSIESKTSICPIGVPTLHNLMRRDNSFRLKIYKFISFRIKKIERRLQLLLFKDAKTRFLEFLNELDEDYGERCNLQNAKKIIHPYTQRDIANLIGVSRPTLNLLMNELKEEGIIEFNRKEIILFEKQ